MAGFWLFSAAILAGVFVLGLLAGRALPARGERDGPSRTESVRGPEPVSAADPAEMRDEEERPVSALAISAHELRTPLAGMAGLAGLLLDTDLTPEQKTYAEAIRGSGTAALELVDDVLGAASAQAAGTPLPPAPFQPRELVERVAELLAPRAHAKGVEITAFADTDVPQTVTGEAGRIRQIVLNLAGNAVKYTRSGGVGIRIERRGEQFGISVHDTGPGLDPDIAAHLFESFAHGIEAEAGTGLGLAISRRLLEDMGGTIAFETRSGRGTTFTALLPMAMGAAGEPDDVDFTGQSFLFAGHSPFELPWMAEALGQSGATIALAADAEGVDRLMATRTFTTIILHHSLGNAIADIARRARAAQARVIGVMTPGERHRHGASLDGVLDNFLISPVRTRTLIAVASGAIGPRSAPVPTGAMHLTALLAEDEAVNALLARAHLERLGYRASTVGDGAAAVAAFGRALDQGTPFDLVMLDLRLPGLDGFAAARHIRAVEAERRVAPVALLGVSAAVDDTARREADTAGMDGLIAKPVDGAAIARALKGARQARAG